MKKRLLKIATIFTLITVLSLIAVEVNAQCPMCRMSAESNLNAGGTAGKGLNAGILYMLSTPYIMVALVGYFWYRNRKRQEEEEIVMSN